MSMPIESKKQSKAKNDWMKENSKIYGVRVMKRSESDMYNYIEEQCAKGVSAATLFKIALREHMQIEEIMRRQEEEEK